MPQLYTRLETVNHDSNTKQRTEHLGQLFNCAKVRCDTHGKEMSRHSATNQSTLVGLQATATFRLASDRVFRTSQSKGDIFSEGRLSFPNQHRYPTNKIEAQSIIYFQL